MTIGDCLNHSYCVDLGLLQVCKSCGVVSEFRNDTQIIIESHRQTYVCAITGKISTEVVKIGEAWISKEGIKKLIQYMDR